MGEEVVKLLGAWPSPYYFRVIWALKLKGIPYETIEEDLFNKSALLLQHNSVHKKIPVLIHDDKSICESSVILEYVDEVWSQNPLLPKDPYQRAVARFWIKFLDDKSPLLRKLLVASGEEQEEAVREIFEVLEIIEAKVMVEKNKFSAGGQVGMVDIVLGCFGHWVGVLQQMAPTSKLLDPTRFPRFQQWLNHFKEAPVIKENLPDPGLMLKFYKRRREAFLQTPN